MPRYHYKALDKYGREICGTVDSSSEEIVIRRLRGMGYFTAQVAESKAGVLQLDLADLPIVRLIGRILTFGRVRLRDLSTFTRQLSTLIGAGLPMLQGLRILHEQIENKNLMKAMEGITADVEAGARLSQAMAKHPRIFNRLYVNMIGAGETGGALENILERLAIFNEKSAAVRSRARSAMSYPLVVLAIALVVLAIILMKVLPRFQEMFEGMGAELPGLTVALVDGSEWVQSNWYAIPIAIIGLTAAMRFISSTSAGGYVLDWIALRLPIFGAVVRKVCIARFARTFGTLLDTGIPIVQTLSIVRETAGNRVIARAVSEIQVSVRDGNTVSEPMRDYPIFPPLAVHMVAVGEETGALDRMLVKVAEAYEHEVDDAIEGMGRMIEPLMIGLLGIVIGTVVIALYMPVYSMINAIG